MQEPRFSARFRYLDAGHVKSQVAAQPMCFQGLEVRNTEGEKLGSIDGFIFDMTSGQLYYMVIDSGGWFKTRRYLLPVGHARVDLPHNALRIDLDKPTLKLYPEFEQETFEKLSDEDLRRFEEETVSACCPPDADTLGENPLVWGYERWMHYRQPEWWNRPTYSAGDTEPAGFQREDSQVVNSS